MSGELHPAISPYGRCELGMLLSALRAGAELRCGTLDGELGPLELALSSAAAFNVLTPPRGAPMLRGGVDLSLAGSDVVPLLDVYFGYVPWRRAASYPDSDRKEWTAYGSAFRERGEYRLSIPLGVAFRDLERTARSSNTIILALVPELTLTSRYLEPSSATREVHIEQTFALFIVLGNDLEIRWSGK
jgi:hypothetical protein